MSSNINSGRTQKTLVFCFAKDKRCPSKSHYNFVFFRVSGLEIVQQTQISLDLIRFNCADAEIGVKFRP